MGNWYLRGKGSAQTKLNLLEEKRSISPKLPHDGQGILITLAVVVINEDWSYFSGTESSLGGYLLICVILLLL